MTEPFGHEKLIVYQTGLRFAAVRRALLDGLPRRVAACDHLTRGAESILVNIAEGNGRFTGTDQAAFYETAYKAAIQSMALIDLAAADAVAEVPRVEQGREWLRRIAAMLSALSKVATRD
jgi:four helix bundle protein